MLKTLQSVGKSQNPLFTCFSSVDLLKQYGNSLLFVWTPRGRGEDFWDWFTVVVKKNPGDHWRVQLFGKFGSAGMMLIFSGRQCDHVVVVNIACKDSTDFLDANKPIELPRMDTGLGQ